MEFLKELFGSKSLSYEEFVQAVNAHNGNEANKEKQIKLANLGSGEYVGKGKHDSEIEKLNALLSGKTSELEAANNLIADFKKNAKGNEEMQGKITGYETQVQSLQKELQETKIKAALKVALLTEKVSDVPYMTFKIEEKLKEQGKTLELDENENIKGWDEIISGMKTQLPNHFTKAGSGVQIEANPLPTSDNNRTGVTKEEFAKMGYQSRLKLKQEQPEAYAELTGKSTN